MSEEKSKPIIINKGGLGFMTTLALIFIVLKLCGVIGWSWWWVLAPLWIPLAIGFAIAGLSLFVIILAAIAIAVFGK